MGCLVVESLVISTENALWHLCFCTALKRYVFFKWLSTELVMICGATLTDYAGAKRFILDLGAANEARWCCHWFWWITGHRKITHSVLNIWLAIVFHELWLAATELWETSTSTIHTNRLPLHLKHPIVVVAPRDLVLSKFMDDFLARWLILSMLNDFSVVIGIGNLVQILIRCILS